MQAKPGFETKSNQAQPDPTQTQSDGSHHQPAMSAVEMLSNLGSQTASGSGSSKTPGEVHKLFEEIAARMQKKQRSIKVYSMVVEDPKLNIPAVVLYTIANSVVYFTPLLLEQLGQRLENAIEQVHGTGTIEVTRPTSMYYDTVMRAVCLSSVKFDVNARSLPVKEFVAASHVVIGRGIELENIEKLSPFYDAAVSCFKGNIRGDAGLPMSELTTKILSDKSIQLIARNDIHPGSTYQTTAGQIIAGDFCINLIARPVQQDTSDIHNVGSEVMLSSLTGFVDFAYRAPDATPPHQLPNQHLLPVPAYDPMVIVTDISPLGKSVSADDDILSQLLGLAALSGTISNLRWSTIFTRSSADSGKKTSIGAFGLEHNPFGPTVKHEPKMINVTSGELAVAGDDATTPLTVIQTYCTPTMTVGIDIIQGGPLSWVQALLAGATRGSPQENLIISELDAFSNGMFSKIWGSDKNILSMPSIEVLLGHYTDDKGEIRSISSTDYLYTLEASGADISVMEPYSRALSPSTCDKIALNEMRKIIKLLHPNAEFTGLATRVYISTDFINSLDELLNVCGLSIALEGLNDIVGGTNRSSMLNGVAGQVTGHGTFSTYGGSGPARAPLNTGFASAVPGRRY